MKQHIDAFVANEFVRAMSRSTAEWLQCNITFSMLLAVFTEVPRWTYAFAAIDEPVWVGATLALLIAFATSKAWEEYFASFDRLLLALNLLSLFLAIFTISPVLFAMSETGFETEISVAEVYTYWWRWAWAIGVASTTFLPLVQVAMVLAAQRRRVESVATIAPQTRTVSSSKTVVDVATPSPTKTQRNATKPRSPKRNNNADRQRALQMMSEEIADADIATELARPVSTIRSWRSRYANGHEREVSNA